DLSVAASAATEPGQGSSAMLFWNCSDAVELRGVTVLAARGGSGARGADSSERLGERGLGSLADLDGVSGGPGAPGGGVGCALVAAGGGGATQCGDVDVSGGLGGDARCAAISCSNAGTAPCGNAGCTDYTVNGVCDIAAVRRDAVPNPDAQPGRGPE